MNDQPDNLAPTKPPKPGTGSGCCSKIANFLTIGPVARAWVSLGSLRIELGASLSRLERPAPPPTTAP